MARTSQGDRDIKIVDGPRSITISEVRIEPPSYEIAERLRRYLACRYLFASHFHRARIEVVEGTPECPGEHRWLRVVEASDIDDGTMCYAGGSCAEVSPGDLTRFKFDQWMKRLEVE
jgi:hypothetical protein